MKPLYDVIAKFPAHDDQSMGDPRQSPRCLGNGAEDPISGMSAVLEEARALGELHKQGWKPKRTIIYCAWDGEEPGLLGSVGVGGNARRGIATARRGVLNSDGNERGFLMPGGSHGPANADQRCGQRHSGPGNQDDGFPALAPGQHRASEK